MSLDPKSSTDEGGQHRNRRRRDSWNAECVAERIWTDLREPLDDFP